MKIGYTENMREPLEPRSNLKIVQTVSRSNHKTSVKFDFPIWNSGMDLKWKKRKRETDEEDPKMKQEIKGAPIDGMMRLKRN